MTGVIAETISVDLPSAFNQGWNRLPGVTAVGTLLIIDPGEFFFRNESSTWTVCDWEGVRNDVLSARETDDTTIEQMALDYLRDHGRTTSDAAEVLSVAWEVYSYLFRSEHLEDPSLQRMGVGEKHLRMLREMGTVMSLNRVEQDGHISNVSPAWMFGEACRVVYDATETDAELVDELYHGGWFNEPRRIEQVKAHTALGGRLVHGCQSSVYKNMAGGAVVPFGADIDRFRTELGDFRDEWIQKVRDCAK
ncbi:hypothetical protein [Streptomonospora salina]|uniref:Uncharacterized protein n=1 Tax=Streptomonospora salina TaxID=104205 RepID=A0A841ECW9_9ACTN|nr:hypothetical protein [Streptomonospora salina]MBB6000244.1 hypothetical protein [Streptomonospora salina]